MIKVNAMGDPCPIPVVKTKNAIKELNGSGQVETLVDNEIAVQNLTKMANQKGYGIESEKIENNRFRVVMTIGEGADTDDNTHVICESCTDKNTVVVISSQYMGTGDNELGTMLMKSYIYALSQQDELPSTILFYNSGAKITCEDSPSLEDLKYMEENGVEILTCGTCLNHYKLTDKLKIGGISNMYTIVEKMSQATLIIKP